MAKYPEMADPRFIKPQLRIEFKPFGRWEDWIRELQRLSPTIKRASIAAQVAVANQIVKKVKSHLLQQDLRWRRLTPEYVEYKREHGWDTRMLMASQTYYENIKVFTKGNQHLVFAGVRRGIYGKKIKGTGRSKLEVAQIAAIHEFAINSKRRRPLWNPTIRELGGVKGIEKLYLDKLYRELRRRKVPLERVSRFVTWH